MNNKYFLLESLFSAKGKERPEIKSILDTKPHIYLFHGTPKSNWNSIESKGIDPKKAETITDKDIKKYKLKSKYFISCTSNQQHAKAFSNKGDLFGSVRSPLKYPNGK
jgi:hypothetical protein